ncbi:NUDIX hydrolase [Thioalkalivibrio sulfidiphilus]|uniref:NUDIX hydrolase n=1 Tax=Thioalkalivibrio sulfidiphilus TaxID=1033854 RepID=UPI00037940A2|nr:NUDIX hydrolase [Thioalkalivibrio sulfidiphilus]
MHRQQLLSLLALHRTPFIEEAAFVRRAYDFVSRHPDCFQRDIPTHVTGSTWVVNPGRDRVLLMHHRKLNQWFQPGGHADGDHDILQVALKEAHEETGLGYEHLRLMADDVFDVDIHITEPTTEDASHEHIDIRFLVEIDDRLPVPGNEESHQVIWVPLTAVSRYNNSRSTWRMVEKTRRMRAALPR